MQRISGTFRREGRVIAEDADVWIAVTGSGPHALWYGSYKLRPNAAMEEPGEYHLELEDGRHGAVTISRPSVKSGYYIGGFSGHGPLLGSAT